MIAEAPTRTVVYQRPAPIAEAPRTVVYRTEPELIAESPAITDTRLATYETMPVTRTELEPIAEMRPTTRWSTVEPEIIAEAPARTTWVTTSSQPEWIAERPARRAWYTRSTELAPIAEPTCRTGGLFTPDGTTLSGRGPKLLGY